MTLLYRIFSHFMPKAFPLPTDAEIKRSIENTDGTILVMLQRLFPNGRASAAEEHVSQVLFTLETLGEIRFAYNIPRSAHTPGKAGRTNRWVTKQQDERSA